MDRVIPADAAFLQREGLKALTDMLGAARGDIRFVGGIVRDTLLGIDAADVDLATGHPPDDVVALIRRAGFKAVPTGIAHGTVTAVLPSGPVEVTTLRRDVSTDGRHAVVAFTDDWREDAARRDFTMNALYADPVTLEVVDYFGGLSDLADARVRFIGDPLQRIAEDHLRILRFFRFHARFGNLPDREGLAACAARANDLMALSRERIAGELLKLLMAAGAVATLGTMLDNDILRPVLPEIDDSGHRRFARLVGLEKATDIAPDAIRRLASLLPRDPAIGESVGNRLKLSSAQRKRLVLAMTDSREAPRPMTYRLGRDGALDRALLTADETFDAVAAARAIQSSTIPSFPLSGGALVARGLDRGPDVARTLRAIEDRWVEEDFPDAARVGQLADVAVAQWLADRKA